MAKKKILYWNPTEFEVPDLELDVINHDPDYEITVIRNVPDAEFLKYGADVDALAVDYLEITDELLQHMPNVKVIVRRGVGFEQFHLDAFTKHGVLGCNLLLHGAVQYGLKEGFLYSLHHLPAQILLAALTLREPGGRRAEALTWCYGAGVALCSLPGYGELIQFIGR